MSLNTESEAGGIKLFFMPLLVGLVCREKKVEINTSQKRSYFLVISVLTRTYSRE